MSINAIPAALSSAPSASHVPITRATDKKISRLVTAILQGIKNVCHAIFSYLVVIPLSAVGGKISDIVRRHFTWEDEVENPPPMGAAAAAAAPPPAAPSSPKVFIPNQPIGIHNRNNNCFANAVMQLFINVPSVKQAILQLSDKHPLKSCKQFIQNYEAAQSARQLVAKGVSTQPLRVSIFGNNTGRSQQDAHEFLLGLLNQLPGDIFSGVVKLLNKRQVQIDHVPCVQLQLNSVAGKEAALEEMLVSAMHHGKYYVIREGDKIIELKDEGEERDMRKNWEVLSEKDYFEKVPDQLFLHVKRFKRSDSQELSKDSSDIAVPLSFELPEKPHLVITKERARYICDGFVLHGGNLNHGHYVSYIKKPDGSWWYCNDDNVYRIAEDDVKKNIGKSYILHYQKEL